LPPEDLRRAAIYMSGQPYGRAERRTLNLGWATIGRVVEALSGRPADELSAPFLKHSDLGDWAIEALEGRTHPEPSSLAEGAAAAEEAFHRLRTPVVGTEEKYDGVSCQRHRADGRCELFSRELRETAAAFPEIVDAGVALDRELILDGEVLAHRGDRVLPFSDL